MIPAETTSDRLALVPTNPRVKAIAFRFRWQVDTLIARVQGALAAPTEQQLYLQVGGSFRVHPETLRKNTARRTGYGFQEPAVAVNSSRPDRRHVELDQFFL